MEPRKGLMVDVLRHADGTDCTNGGISSAYKRVLLVGDGVPEIFEESDDLPAVKLVYKFGSYHVIPAGSPPWGLMFGGNFIHSCDSRFTKICFGYPIPIHDRRE